MKDTDTDLGDRADRLGEKVDGLGVKVDRHTASLKELGERQTRTERMSTRTAVAAVIAVAILAAGAWLGYRQFVLAEEQRRVTQEALCPVFGLLLGGYDPSTRPEGPARDQYIATYDTFRTSYGALRCTAQFVPPRTPGS